MRTFVVGQTDQMVQDYLEKWICWIRAEVLPHVRIHDLRHTAASWLAQSGASLVMIRDWLGHTSFAETTRYSHLLTEDMKKAAANVTRYIKGSCTPPTQP